MLLGAGAPLSKVLVSRMDPIALAGALYTGPTLIAALALLVPSVSNEAGLLLCFVSLRTMGAARTAAFGGVGPLAGALLSLVLFRTPVTWAVVAPLGLTAAAVLVVGHDDERRSLAWKTAER
jgi:drug/metabolite transporter (DMT)-like permease